MAKAVCTGFKASGIASGIKKNNQKDLGLIYTQTPAKAAGVFTRNQIQAAPVIVNRKRIQSGEAQAIVVNSGNANCCTGQQGMEDAFEMARLTAFGLGLGEEKTLVASTGVIGVKLPISKIKAALPRLVKALDSEGFENFAHAIMTTDTIAKIVTRHGRINGKEFTVTGVAKGSGMVCPNMATLLAFVCSDIDVQSDYLGYATYIAAERSFNRVNVDGDTSTNDMVLTLANGMSGAVVENSLHKASFQGVLDEVLKELSKMIVQDAEGATKCVDIKVMGAKSDEDAHRVASTIANSNLVKTAFFGEDANWGRILAAAGRAGVTLKSDRIDVFFNDVRMCHNGIGCGDMAENQATQVMKKPEYTVTVDLKLGSGQASMLTCDFSLDYVRINADYRS
jgi:glutamate N-acetyltransferase/amino-acid N-acetyltransferase